MSCTRVPHVYEYTHLALQYSRAAENNNNTCIKNNQISFTNFLLVSTSSIPGTVPGTCVPGTGTCNHKKVTVIVIRDTYMCGTSTCAHDMYTIYRGVVTVTVTANLLQVAHLLFQPFQFPLNGIFSFPS